jgi:hypothetical protein
MKLAGEDRASVTILSGHFCKFKEGIQKDVQRIEQRKFKKDSFNMYGGAYCYG